MNKLTSSQNNLTQSDSSADPAVDQPDPHGQLDRRGILRYGGGAALAGAAAAVMGSSALGAATATGPLRYGVNNAAGPAATGLTSTNAKVGLHVKNAGLGNAILGEARSGDGGGFGVVGTGVDGAGVVGGTYGKGPGIRAHAQPGAGGSALEALTFEPNNASATVLALQNGAGHGVYSQIGNEANPNGAVFGRTVGTGHAVMASVVNANNGAAAVRAATKGTGPGVEASSAAGMGARFAGKTAQMQLVPSPDATHPTLGIAGQLFVDASTRLWFCRGDSDWQQMA